MRFQYLSLMLIVLFSILGCKKDHLSNIEAAEYGADVFWSTCAFHTDDEMLELNKLENLLKNSTSLEKDADTFNKFLNLLTLRDKTDEQLLSCEQSSLQQRKQLLQHFIYLALAYNDQKFSFVNKPRLSSVFELNYFYDIRDFFQKGNENRDYSEADKKIAYYLLGAQIAMQASLKMRKGLLVEALAHDIAAKFAILKYGRSAIYTQIILDTDQELKKSIANFLNNGGAFLESWQKTKDLITKKTYPFLRDRPFWPEDLSEEIPSRYATSNTVFGLNTSRGGTALGTGGLAKLNNKIIFVTTGHWSYRRQIYLLRQHDAEPFGSAASKLIWLDNALDIFNFSEELVVPLLEALNFTDAQVTALKKKIGDNPFSSSFKIFHAIFPWMDFAMGIPSQALIAESGVALTEIKSLAEPPLRSSLGYFIGYGISENLIVGDISTDKAPGLRRFNQGQVISSIEDFKSLVLTKLWMQTPLTLSQLIFAISEYQNRTPRLSQYYLQGKPILPSFAMRFGPRNSGAPLFSNDAIVGVLRGEQTEEMLKENKFVGLRVNKFSSRSLAFINALLNHSNNLNNISKADLINLLKTHMLGDAAVLKHERETLLGLYELAP